jgi:hypothetical protein
MVYVAFFILGFVATWGYCEWIADDTDGFWDTRE